uniref:Minor capsid protein P8 central region domain-containing protein n=1 Tax=viral metagenome TaxID=1070528 RepID=A0A6C0LLD6_9ZZZZ
MENKYNNGRVNIKTTDTNQLFQMYDKIPANQCVSFRNPTEGLWNDTPLSNLFFSKENIDNIQNGLRAGVFKRSNGQYTIGIQDCDVLKIVMRSTFLQYSANQTTNIKEQVDQLNQMVLNYCIQQVYSEAQGYIKYIYDASTLVVPIAHPVMADNTDRQLEFKTWF